jgi:hypothetical protein
MQAVIEITDYDYDNTGQSMVYYKKAKKTDTGYAYDPMENEIYQLTNNMVIVNHYILNEVAEILQVTHNQLEYRLQYLGMISQ